MTVVLQRDDDDKAVDREVARPRALLRHILLLVLSRSPGHGYHLAWALGDWQPTSIGQVYRLLRQLENGGLAHSEWEVAPTGPARRAYALTTRGEDAARECIASLEHLDAILASYMARYEAQRPRTLNAGPTGGR